MLRALTMNAPGESADKIENCTFDEISVGDSASLTRTLTPDDIALFAVMSGDVNPAHMDERYAEVNMFHRIIAHGMWGRCTRIGGPRHVPSGSRHYLSRTGPALPQAREPRRHLTVITNGVAALGWVSDDGVRSISVLVTNGKQRRCFPCVAIYEPASRL